jgi:hypothetical protein
LSYGYSDIEEVFHSRVIIAGRCKLYRPLTKLYTFSKIPSMLTTKFSGDITDQGAGEQPTIKVGPSVEYCRPAWTS